MRTFKQGSYLIRDDLSGKIVFADEIVERWDGTIMRRVGTEDEVHRHPQDFIRAKADPYPVSPMRPGGPTALVDFAGTNVVQGIVLPLGAAQHLYPASPGVNGIGRMRIVRQGITRVSAMSCATSFIVR
jgi:hypothetical protein